MTVLTMNVTTVSWHGVKEYGIERASSYEPHILRKKRTLLQTFQTLHPKSDNPEP